MKKKIEIAYRENKSIIENHFEKSGFYREVVLLPLGQEVELSCNYRIEKIVKCFSLVIELLVFKGEERIKKDVLISKVDLDLKNAKLEIIEVPEDMRGCQLGTHIFSLWLEILGDIQNEESICLERIYGIIDDGSNFTPKYSKKLYRKFDKYQCYGEKLLVLNRKKLKNMELEYIIYTE